MFKKRVTTLLGKFTFSFFLLSLLAGVAIVAIIYVNQQVRIKEERIHKAYKFSSKLEELYKFSKENRSILNPNQQKKDVDDYKLALSEKTDDCRLLLDELIGKGLYEQFHSGDSSNVELPIGDFNDEEQLLYLSYQLFSILRKDVDFIQYNELMYDSLYDQKILVEQQMWKKDSSIAIIPMIKEYKKRTFYSEVYVAFGNIGMLISKIEKKISQLDEIYQGRMKRAENTFYLLMAAIFLSGVILVFVVYRYLSTQIFSPLHKVRVAAQKIVDGAIDTQIEDVGDHEIGELATQINVLTLDIKNAHSFIKNLNLDDLGEVVVDEDSVSDSTLTKALVEMRGKLADIALKENERNWVIEGQALFSDILSKYSSDFERLSDEIIKKLVQYVGALQGGLFIVEREDDEEECLNLVSCFAYDRKKFISSKVELGEGVVGQVWQERKPVYITDLPEDHMLIKSGLGNQRPSNLLVIPLIDNNVIYGVVELAAFKSLESYKIEFVHKIAENIATALSGVEINKRTQLLLLESQDLTSKMKEQEEEMLQNLEELQATQEEMRRREIQKENEMTQLQERVEKKLEESEQKELDLQSQVLKLQEELENAQVDNEGVRRLTKEIEELKEAHDAQIKDLEETIRIKDLRVEKLRKKINKPS